MKWLDVLPNRDYIVNPPVGTIHLNVYWFHRRDLRDEALSRMRPGGVIDVVYYYAKRKTYVLNVQKGVVSIPDIPAFNPDKCIITCTNHDIALQPVSLSGRLTASASATSTSASVLVASLVASDADSRILSRFLTAISKLNYPKDMLEYAFLVDGGVSAEIIAMLRGIGRGKAESEGRGKGGKKGREEGGEEGRKEKGGEEGRVRILKSSAKFYIARFQKLALLRNFLVMEALGEHDYVLFIDSDVVSVPSDLIQQLQQPSCNICAPMVFIENYQNYGNTYFYDTLAFIHDGVNFCSHYPYIFGKLKLGSSVFQLDSVGTCYLCDANIFRAGIWFSPNTEICEQVSFCSEVRRRGYNVCVNPSVSVLHANLEQYGLKFH